MANTLNQNQTMKMRKNQFLLMKLLLQTPTLNRLFTSSREMNLKTRTNRQTKASTTKKVQQNLNPRLSLNLETQLTILRKTTKKETLSNCLMLLSKVCNESYANPSKADKHVVSTFHWWQRSQCRLQSILT